MKLEEMQPELDQEEPEMSDEEFAQLEQELDTTYRRYMQLNKIYLSQTGRNWR